MKKNFLFSVIAAAVVAIPAGIATAQSTLSNVWEQDVSRQHSDAGSLIATYSNTIGTITEVITAAVVNDYTALNISSRDENGSLLWSRNIYKPQYTYWSPKKMVLNSGDPLIAGEVYNSQEFRYEIFVLKMDEEGNQKWFRTFFDEKNYLFLSGVDADPTVSNLYFSYWFTKYNLSGNILSIIETIKLDAISGSEVWENQKTIMNQNAVINALVYDQSGVYQTGYISNSSFGYDIFTMKCDLQGNFAWMQTYSSGDNINYSIGMDIVANNAGKIVVAATEGYHNLTLLGYSAAGNIDFVQKNNFGESSYIYNVKAEDNLNSATYVAAEVDSFGIAKIYLTRLADNGTKIWRKFVDNNYLNQLKIDPSGQGVSIMGSYYDLEQNNYFSKIHAISESGDIWLSYEFEDFPGYNAVADFATDGSSYYIEGLVQQSQIKTDEMTSRWDIVPLKLENADGNAAMNLSVYPNPCANYTIVSFNGTSPILYIYDLCGRLMYQSTGAGQKQNIDTQSWPGGVYFVKVFEGASWQTLKLIKE
jgi:hypothetical protein